MPTWNRTLGTPGRGRRSVEVHALSARERRRRLVRSARTPYDGPITLTFELPAHFLDVRSQRVGFVLLAAFLVSFLFIRTSARLMRSPKVPWWPGSVTTDSGLHLHHLVWGIVLLLLAGFLGFTTTPSSPWTEILAGAFGVGAG